MASGQSLRAVGGWLFCAIARSNQGDQDYFIRKKVLSKMDHKKRIILVIVLLSYFVTAIDGSIVITGLEKIAADPAI